MDDFFDYGGGPLLVLLVGLLAFCMYGMGRAQEADDRTDAYCASIGGVTLDSGWPSANTCIVGGKTVVAP